MKKRIGLILVFAVVILLAFPIPKGTLNDGGTRVYTALTYTVVDWHHIYQADGIQFYDETKIYFFPLNFLSIDELLEREQKNFVQPQGMNGDGTSLDRMEIGKDTFGENTQYIRTNGSFEGAEYPKAVVIDSVEKLTAYYEENKGRYFLERRDDLSTDNTVGFLDACDFYDESYFTDRILVLVLLEEGSGSIRHVVTNVVLNSAEELEIRITTKIPETGTCDMAQWHLFVSPFPGVKIKDASQVKIILDKTEDDHAHTLAQEMQTVQEHFIGYCGNTQTTVHFGADSSYTFMGGESVELTDLLLHLAYDPDKVCKCSTDCRVDTEFQTGYEIRISDGFVRCSKGQAQLTEEQLKRVKEIITWAKEKSLK